MEFKNLKIKEICLALWYTAGRNESSKNRMTHIIGLQTGGRYVHRLKDRQIILEEDTLFFLNQRDDYSVRMEKPGPSLSIHFTTYEPIDTDSFCVKISKQTEPLRLLELIESHFTSRTDDLRLSASFYEFCSLLNKIYEKNAAPKDRRILHAENYLNSHFREPDCLALAAESSDLSRRRFNDLFRNYYHMTPNEYLTSLKIDYAKKLLLTEYLSVSETASLSGFSDIYYFSKVFKKETGMTPSAYRRSLTPS